MSCVWQNKRNDGAIHPQLPKVHNSVPEQAAGLTHVCKQTAQFRFCETCAQQGASVQDDGKDASRCAAKLPAGLRSSGGLCAVLPESSGFCIFLSCQYFCRAQGRNPEREPQERGESAQLRFAYSLPSLKVPSQTLLPYLSPLWFARLLIRGDIDVPINS